MTHESANDVTYSICGPGQASSVVYHSIIANALADAKYTATNHVLSNASEKRIRLINTLWSSPMVTFDRVELLDGAARGNEPSTELGDMSRRTSFERDHESQRRKSRERLVGMQIGKTIFIT